MAAVAAVLRQAYVQVSEGVLCCVVLCLAQREGVCVLLDVRWLDECWQGADSVRGAAVVLL